MATLLALLDDLRDRLNDVTDVQVTKPAKIRYLNFGIAATFPSLYRVVRDSSLALATGTYEYDLPGTINESSRIFRLEVESSTAGLYWPIEDYQVLPGSPVTLALPGLPAAVGSHIRVFAAVPLLALAVDADVFTGPGGTEELPVLYAMGCIAGRRIDDRIDHRRYSSVAGQNGVVVETLEGASQFWFNQFDMALEKAAVPLPGA